LAGLWCKSMRYGDGNVYGARLELCQCRRSNPGWRRLHPGLERLSARR
jgi:hypothetical protein